MIRILLICMTLSLLACTDHPIVSEEELNEYVLAPENGLIKKLQTNGVDIEVIYRPAALVIAQQLRGVTDQAARMKAIHDFEGLSYFIIKLSMDGQEIENGYSGNPEMFARVVSYLSSEVASNIYMVDGRDTIRAVDAVYARMFGAATATSLLAVFDCNVRENDGMIRFCFDDGTLGIGKNEFVFDLNDIKKAPTLNNN